jgi:TonB family protein
MKKIIATVVFASACATTGRSLPVDSPSSTGMAPTFSMNNAQSPQSDTASAWFPTLASDAVLPSAARYQLELSTERDRYELAVKLCVAPNGSVASVELTQSSGSELLDQAVTRDVAAWQFESFKAPAHIRVCKPIALGYEPVAEMSHLRIPLVRMSDR